MAKSKKFIEIPIDLARLLSSEDEDFKSKEQCDEARAVARALLRLLMNI